MSMKNFRAEDMPGKEDDMKVAYAQDSQPEQPQSQQDQAQDQAQDQDQQQTQEEESAEDEDEDDEVPSGTTREILDWVGDDPARAQRALDQENASERPRSGVTTPLNKIINGETG
jgi:hypothetical protein